MPYTNRTIPPHEYVGVKRAVAVAVLATSLLAASWYDSQPTQVRGPSCSQETAAGVSLGDFVNRVRWQGRDYVAAGTASPLAVRFGERLGSVRCRVGDSLTPFPYAFQDGDAALLPAGTPVHAVRGFHVSDAVGVDFDGKRWLFRATRRTTD